jgi:sialic acid synthase SpsE
MNAVIFDELFVLELANNHLGSLERGLKIVLSFAQIARFNGMRVAIKLQFRDVDTFIHKDYRNREDIRYIKKTLATKLSNEDLAELVGTIRKNGCVTMCTPFDETSVDLCVEFGVQILKIASSDLNDWPLIEKIATTKKPVIVSTGGASIKDLDDLVLFFEHRNIPLAINHCVSLYPTEDHELDLNQIDFLKNRYPNHTIGFSTHEYHDWESSVMIAYAKGARTFERHVDIQDNDTPVSTYCSLPDQVDVWFKAYKKAKEMCGNSGQSRRIVSKKEEQYLSSLVRGVYARRDLPAGYVLTHERMKDDLYLAVPLLKGQISCRELMSSETTLVDIKKDQPILIESIDSPYANHGELKKIIYERGL